MSASRDLLLTNTQDRTAGLTSGGGGKTEHPRALNIQIDNVNGKFRMKLFPHADYASLFTVKKARSPLKPSTLWRLVNDCTMVWRKRVVEYLLPGGRKFPFQETSERPLSWLGITLPLIHTGIISDLAIAGEKLFQQIFLPPAEGYEEMHEIGSALQKLVATEGLWVKVTSDEFYAPWNLMYLGDSLTSPYAEKFWGYQHLIEHDPADSSLPTRVFQPKLNVALHFDEGIDRSFADIMCNAKISGLLRSYETIGINERHFKDEFLGQLRKGTSEDFFYFCCHASAEGGDPLSFANPRMMLTDPRPPEQQINNDDREAIEPDDIDLRLKNTKLAARPIVFMNCCQVARMNSIFYQGFAATFLNNHASAVIGPNIEIPVVFARDFAREFFDKFFQGGVDQNLGSVLLALRREFFKVHENPLGLVYLLYRGADIHIERPILKRSIQ